MKLYLAVSKVITIAVSIFCVGADYQMGIGIGDVTGPIVEINFLGYANPEQTGSGLHLRQYARAYVIGKDSNRICFVSIEAAMIGFGLRAKVLDKLKSLYGNTYTEQNVILSGTHTHSGPGGFMEDVIYDFSTFGFVSETSTSLTEGIIQAIVMAHNSIQNAKIYLKSGTLLDANINRSPLAYLLNPESERMEYLYDVDKEMVQLKFVASPSNELLGAINWFPVHPTSMNHTNTLVSSDNVGYASIKLEKYFNKDALIGKGPFIATFASTNLGDVSPNIKGPLCIDTGLPCDAVTSTCNGKSQKCIASGPGEDMFESTKIIGTRMYEKALEMLESDNGREVEGPIKFGHRYLDMPEQTINYTFENGTTVQARGCLPALGYSFAAGTTDGPGMFDFQQGTTTSTNPFWEIVKNLIGTPTASDISCQSPKPILLNTGRANLPYRWQPSIVSLQLALLGDVVLVAVPGELTTMAGRRLRKALKSTFINNGGSNNVDVIIAGLCNTYSSYVTTFEEYQMQRYEAASTLYGPHTLSIYQYQSQDLLSSLMMDVDFDKGVAPERLNEDSLLSFTLPVVFDANLFNSFGDCLQQPKATIPKGTTVTAKFASSNPRTGNLKNYNLIKIQRLVNNVWQTISTDADWETKYHWKRVGLAGSEVTITWFVNMDVPTGQYRIVHSGYYKPILGSIKLFNGVSNKFNVT